MAEEETPKKQTRAPGERSRARVVEQAAQLATIEGIEGISIGRLAEVTGIAKSSVYALFGSKKELQLATINAARDSFIIEVVAPALNETEPGRQRLLALCEGFLSYVERRVFPAINIDRSGTRKEELIYHPEELQRIYGLRRAMQGLGPIESMEMLIQRLKKTKSNAEFLLSLSRQ